MRNPGSRKSPKLLSSTLHLDTHIYYYEVKHFTDSPLRALSPGVWKHPSSALVPQHTNTVRKHWPEPEEVKAKAWPGAGGSGAAAGPARHPRAAQPRLRTRTRTPPSWHGAVQRCWAWPGLLTSQLGCCLWLLTASKPSETHRCAANEQQHGTILFKTQLQFMLAFFQRGTFSGPASGYDKKCYCFNYIGIREYSAELIQLYIDQLRSPDIFQQLCSPLLSEEWIAAD